ncbi:hypothetical protein [Ferrimonas marina]|uniref:Uncharacterized protein n=1 Tax=Ferrimonas marina TaxID=299255 RepID=A0A1M5U2I6_9GAMM|nr:hypothetical protein [Ferrimonas marina]SHH57080.1 hypothetical protein SAMN02745129_2375 [Ferrimonas marina]
MDHLDSRAQQVYQRFDQIQCLDALEVAAETEEAAADLMPTLEAIRHRQAVADAWYCREQLIKGSATSHAGPSPSTRRATLDYTTTPVRNTRPSTVPKDKVVRTVKGPFNAFRMYHACKGGHYAIRYGIQGGRMARAETIPLPHCRIQASKQFVTLLQEAERRGATFRQDSWPR